MRTQSDFIIDAALAELAKRYAGDPLEPLIRNLIQDAGRSLGVVHMAEPELALNAHAQEQLTRPEDPCEIIAPPRIVEDPPPPAPKKKRGKVVALKGAPAPGTWSAAVIAVQNDPLHTRESALRFFAAWRKAHGYPPLGSSPFNEASASLAPYANSPAVRRDIAPIQWRGKAYATAFALLADGTSSLGDIEKETGVHVASLRNLRRWADERELMPHFRNERANGKPQEFLQKWFSWPGLPIYENDPTWVPEP